MNQNGRAISIFRETNTVSLIRSASDLSAFSLAAFWKVAKAEEVSRDFWPLVGVVRGPVGVAVMLLLRLPHPFSAPLVL